MLKRPAHINFSALAAEHFKKNFVIVSRSGETPPAIIINKGNPAITDKSINLFDENLSDDEPQGAEVFVNERNFPEIIRGALNDYKFSNRINVSDKLLIAISPDPKNEPSPFSLNPVLSHSPDFLVSYMSWQNKDKHLKNFIFAKSEFDIFKNLEKVARTTDKNVFKNNKINPIRVLDPTVTENLSSKNNYGIKKEVVDQYPEIAAYVSQRKIVDKIINQTFTKMTAVIDGMEKIVV